MYVHVELSFSLRRGLLKYHDDHGLCDDHGPMQARSLLMQLLKPSLGKFSHQTIRFFADIPLSEEELICNDSRGEHYLS